MPGGVILVREALLRKWVWEGGEGTSLGNKGVKAFQAGGIRVQKPLGRICLARSRSPEKLEQRAKESWWEMKWGWGENDWRRMSPC